MHATRSGVATFVHDDEAACLEEVRYLLSLLPAHHLEVPPQYECTDPDDRPCDALLEMVPTDPRQPYDIRQVMAEIVDDHELLELHERWAPTIVCALARLGGRTVGLVGNQPMVRAGVIDVLAAQKAARFVSTCNSFNIPLVTLVDVPGFMPGLDQEQAGMIRHGAKLLYAYCNATVPRIQVIVRKAYGGAYIVMDSGSIGADLTLAWPSNEIAVMGASAAVEVLHRRELIATDDPAGMREALVDDYIDSIMHPFAAAERGFVDEIIDPRQTRHALIDGLRLLTTKHNPAGRPGRYGNPPI
jgi:acetyl-CoA carboxylase carboxyltransferase component